MSFPEKIALALSAALVVVFGVYFAVVGRWLATTPVENVRYQPLLIVAVVVLAVLSALSAGLLAIVDRRGAMSFDERDRSISLRAGRVGGVLLSIAVFFVLVLLMLGVAQAWIAQALLLGWVLAELGNQLTTVALYRRGA